jgi:hypothetical protein
MMKRSSEHTRDCYAKKFDTGRMTANDRLCEKAGNRYNKTFAELMDNLRGEASSGLHKV